MKTFKETIDELNEEFFEDFDLWRCDTIGYDDAKMLNILKEYKRRYLEIGRNNLPLD